MTFFFRVEGVAFRDGVPLFEAAPAARRRRVLRDEDGVMTHGSLLAVVGRRGGRETFFDEVGGVFEHNGQPFAPEVSKLLAAQAKARAESRTAQGVEKLVLISGVAQSRRCLRSSSATRQTDRTNQPYCRLTTTGVAPRLV